MRFSPKNLQPHARVFLCAIWGCLGLEKIPQPTIDIHWYPHALIMLSPQLIFIGISSFPGNFRSQGLQLQGLVLQKTGFPYGVLSPEKLSDWSNICYFQPVSRNRGGPERLLWLGRPTPSSLSSPNWIPQPNWSASSRVRCCEVPWCSKTWRASPCLCTSWHGRPPVFPSHRVSVMFLSAVFVELKEGAASRESRKVGNYHIVHHIYIYIYMYTYIQI